MNSWCLRLIAALCCLGIAGARASIARAQPQMQTIAQMAHNEGWDPDDSAAPGGPPRMSRRVPRNFPLPLNSHDLQTSDIVPSVSVACAVPEAERFYEAWFQKHDWRIDKRMKAPGLIGYIACKEGQCVNVSALDSENGRAPSRISFLFYREPLTGPETDSPPAADVDAPPHP